MTDTVLSRFFLQTNGSKGCSKNKKSTQRSQQQQQKEITLNDGCWWWMLAAAEENQTNREKNNTTIFFGENQKASENQISKNNTKSWENDANLRKEKVPELSHTHTLSLSLSLSQREFLEQKNRRRIERPRACSSIT